jgi:hypothetical protein
MILNKDVLLPEAAAWSVVECKSGCLIYVPFKSETDAIIHDEWLKAEVAKLA